MIILALTPALMVGKITDAVGGSGGPATPVLWRKWGCYPLKGYCKPSWRFWRILESIEAAESLF